MRKLYKILVAIIVLVAISEIASALSISSFNICNISKDPSKFNICYLGKTMPIDVSITTNDSNVVSYPTLQPGKILNSTNSIILRSNKEYVDIVFAMNDFYPSGAAKCPRSNVLHTENTWQFRINRNGELSEWQYVKNFNPNKGYCSRGVSLGRLYNGDTWEIELRGTIPTPCVGNWNLNDNSRYVFLINNYTCSLW